MSKVIDALCLEHDSIQSVLSALEREVVALSQLGQPHPADFALIWSAIDYFNDFADLVHHPKEDLVFEQLRQADPVAAQSVGDLAGFHAALTDELLSLANALKAIAEDNDLPSTDFVDRARAFIDHQRLHLAMEEARFFPAAERTLGRNAWAGLESDMAARLDPLIGGPSAERFEALRRHINNQQASRRAASPLEGTIPR